MIKAKGLELTGIDVDDLKLIEEYVKALETGPTSDHCLCEWSEVQPGMPRIRTSVNMACPVHTREGLLLGFLKHTRNLVQDKETKQEVTGLGKPEKEYLEGLPAKPTETRPIVHRNPNFIIGRKVQDANVRFVDPDDDFA